MWSKQIRCVRKSDGKRVFYDMQGQMLPVVRSTEDYGDGGHTMGLLLSADCIDFTSDDASARTDKPISFSAVGGGTTHQ